MTEQLTTWILLTSLSISSELGFVFTQPQNHISKNAPLLRETREAEDECFSNITVSLQGGNLTSPGYPNPYDSDLDCRWLLHAPDDSSIVLKIVSLELELARDCELDYLQIYAGPTTLSSLAAQLCGTVRDKTVFTNSSKVLLVFHTDPSYEENGFLVEYYIESLSGCQTALTKPSGTVTSPGFPDSYPDNADCWTLISVEENKSVLLQFDLIDLEYDENCTYDYVEVFDGANKDAPSIGRYCRNDQKETFQSTSNAVLLHFFSDHLVVKKGFRAHYSSVAPTPDVRASDVGGCLWESEPTNGTIASPNYPQKYPSNSKCSILLTAPPGEVVTLVFDTLQLEIEVNCSYDYLEVLDGVSNVVVGKFCGRGAEPKEVTSKENVLRLVFFTDDFGEFSGFKARYWFHNPNADSTQEPSSSTAVPSTSKPSASPIEDKFHVVPENATLRLGSSYMLPCAFGNPTAKIRWLKDEQFMGGTNPLPGLKFLANNTLWIQSMKKQLAGAYKCTAVMPETSRSVTAWVTVEKNKEDESCNIVLRKSPKDSIFTEGEFSYFECLAAGADIEVSWEKDGFPLQSGKHTTLTGNGFLFIDSATTGDSGVYTCVVVDHVTKCEKRIDAQLTINGKAKINEICGRPKLQPSKDKPRLEHGKIIGGHRAKEGTYPWQVMLWEKHLKAFCGAAVLNERWIVTAAHCFRSYPNLRWEDVIVKLGKIDREEYEEGEVETRIGDVASLIIHPSYSPLTFDNDIALIRLADHVRFTDNILPICLGDQELDDKIFFHSGLQMGTVTGWGKLKERGGSPRYLQEIKLPLVLQKTCIASTSFQVTRNMFCAGYAQEIIGDACQGDSGGPFIMSHDGKWYLVGIVSWGEGCGKPGKFGFYTRVNNYLPWIKGIIKS